MKGPLYLRGLMVGAFVMALPSLGRAHPASEESIEWATANSDRVVVGKVIKAETVNKHDVVTIEVHQTLRGDQEPKTDDLPPKITFVIRENCSGSAQGWLEDKLPMMFFLVKIDGAKHLEQIPKGFKWALHDKSAVALGKTKREWPGTIDVFTRWFDYLTDPTVIVKHVSDYARSLPPERIVDSISVRVPHGSSAYDRVFPPEFPGNAFYLQVPVDKQLRKALADCARDVIGAVVIAAAPPGDAAPEPEANDEKDSGGGFALFIILGLVVLFVVGVAIVSLIGAICLVGMLTAWLWQRHSRGTKRE